MNRIYILANWKMNCLTEEAAVLSANIGSQPIASSVLVALFPPATALATVANTLQGSPVALGGQDCSAYNSGAYTGDVSAAMLKDAGCSYVIVGHSERRTLHQETDEIIKRKAENALAGGLIPVICVGESDAERTTGKHLQVIEKQIKNSIPIVASGSIIVAYEPVWAIGTGKIPTQEDIKEVHKTIASLLTCDKSGAQIPIVYGGSVKAANAHEILAIEGVDGVLVGGASLQATEFASIIKAAEKVKQ